MTCIECFEERENQPILSCSICTSKVHLECIDPPLDSTPLEWVCLGCKLKLRKSVSRPAQVADIEAQRVDEWMDRWNIREAVNQLSDEEFYSLLHEFAYEMRISITDVSKQTSVPTKNLRPVIDIGIERHFLTFHDIWPSLRSDLSLLVSDILKDHFKAIKNTEESVESIIEYCESQCGWEKHKVIAFMNVSLDPIEFIQFSYRFVPFAYHQNLQYLRLSITVPKTHPQVEEIANTPLPTLMHLVTLLESTFALNRTETAAILFCNYQKWAKFRRDNAFDTRVWTLLLAQWVLSLELVMFATVPSSVVEGYEDWKTFAQPFIDRIPNDMKASKWIVASEKGDAGVVKRSRGTFVGQVSAVDTVQDRPALGASFGFTVSDVLDFDEKELNSFKLNEKELKDFKLNEKELNICWTESFHVQSEIALNWIVGCGRKVSCMDWIKVNGNVFLSVGYYSDRMEHFLDLKCERWNFIDVWRVSTDQSDLHSRIWYAEGFAWDIKWIAVSELDTNTIGLLCVSTSLGAVNVYAIPSHPIVKSVKLEAKRRITIEGLHLWKLDVICSENGISLVIGSQQGSILLYHLESGLHRTIRVLNQTDPITALRSHPSNSSLIAFGNFNGTFAVVDVRDGSIVSQFEFIFAIRRIEWVPSSFLCFVATETGVRVADLMDHSTFSPPFVREYHLSETVMDFAVVFDGTRVFCVIGYEDGVVLSTQSGIAECSASKKTKVFYMSVLGMIEGNHLRQCNFPHSRSKWKPSSSNSRIPSEVTRRLAPGKKFLRDCAVTCVSAFSFGKIVLNAFALSNGVLCISFIGK